jgi:hypothetical protein
VRRAHLACESAWAELESRRGERGETSPGDMAEGVGIQMGRCPGQWPPGELHEFGGVLGRQGLTCEAPIIDTLTNPNRICKNVNKDLARSSPPRHSLGEISPTINRPSPSGGVVRPGALGEIAWVGMAGRLYATQVTDDGGPGEDVIIRGSGGSDDPGESNRKCITQSNGDVSGGGRERGF